MSNPLLVRRAAVLGAGVMGAQIAAHLTNAGVDTVLFDLPAKEGPADGIVLKAIANLGKLSPAPLASTACAETNGAIFLYRSCFQSMRSAIASMIRSQWRSCSRPLS
ncbi:hypothetical protein BXO432_18920 [Xanthomonas oryzae pv. oryzae]|nr:hypothetical protein BXO432_18920 [Xanthomonas oryzae pv. oryzae]